MSFCLLAAAADVVVVGGGVLIRIITIQLSIDKQQQNNKRICTTTTTTTMTTKIAQYNSVGKTTPWFFAVSFDFRLVCTGQPRESHSSFNRSRSFRLQLSYLYFEIIFRYIRVRCFDFEQKTPFTPSYLLASTSKQRV